MPRRFTITGDTAQVDDFRSEIHLPYSQRQMITPNLDQLAEDGLVFKNAYAQQVQITSQHAMFGPDSGC